ncbi:GGDEF domain-containing protein [Fusibacter paucivorans]|uniref:GGDEF domain-containing protein n=1 Tax=Fusibacter paucivorans TaxID=76009 RepID=A0ABS5PK84_9FIRM|nr:GGDEF domain-containing protein [Fusibacter paucivorans]MBS7525423.1 GGDEF domain-containing protein [Fusibacter paucivorans]
MKQLDIYTVVQIFILIRLVCTAVLLFLWIKYGNRYLGIRDMALSFGLTAIALILFLFADQLSVFAGLALPNILVLVGICTFGIGVLTFAEAAVHKKELIAYVAIFVCVMSYFTYNQFSVRYIMLISSSFTIPVYIYIIWQLHWRTSTFYRTFTASVQWVACGFVLMHMMRVGWLLYCHPVLNYHGDCDNTQTLLFALSQVLTLLLAFAIEHMIANKRAHEAYNETKTLAIQLEKKEALASTDALTGIYNRRKIESLIREQHHILVSAGTAFSVLLIDVDHFKNVNDQYGHTAGDAVLRHLSQCIRDNIRGFDDVGRWGGEEFLVLLPNAALDEARKTAERLRRIVSDNAYTQLPELTLTISIGVIEASSAMSIDETLKRVDQMLYSAKANGRNSVFSGNAEVLTSVSGVD